MRHAETCPVCESGDVPLFWEAEALPVFCNVLCNTQAEAARMPRGDIRLAYCAACGFIYNRAFDQRRLTYNVTYENSLHYSARFQTYADALADRLVAEYDLHDKDLLEIACGQGDFLKALCARGGNRGLGFDPSYVPCESEVPGTERVSFVQDLYSERYADRRADFICCRHALEHMDEPVTFLRSLRRSIGDRTKTVVFFEVPNALYTLREMGIWDLIYEHCNYFVADSLHRAFVEADFDVLAVGETFGGQFLTIEARPAAAGGAAPPGALAQVSRDVAAFSKRYVEKIGAWRNKLERMKQHDSRAVVWGSGSKGVTFLNILDPGKCIEYVVDINPRKQGMFVAGAGQRIVAPGALSAYRPDGVIVMNPLYREEIRSTLESLGLDVELDFA